MKKTITLIVIAFFLVQCSSVKTKNAHINDLISENVLKADADFIYKKIQKLHPRTYWYISKNDLDHKFDSLKGTINKPMTSYEFYEKIAPVICEIRQGHMAVSPWRKILTKKEASNLKKKGVNPFNQFEFEVHNDKLYVVKNKSYDKSIQVGSELISINGEKISDLLLKYDKLFASDGYNKTFKKNQIAKSFPSFYIYKKGVIDSVTFTFDEELKSVTIKRKIIDSTEIKKGKSSLSRTEKKRLDKKKDIFGYDSTSKKYMRNLKFIEKDSSIAVMKINAFSKGNYKKFYEESFKKIENFKSKVLIIDLRNNGGGRLGEISNLYSYLTDSDYFFVDKSEITSRLSFLGGNFYTSGSIAIRILKYVLSPLYVPVIYSLIHKKEDQKYYYSMYSSKKKVSKNAFKGKVYVLINGGSFSASSIISSNLKGSKRATFVGEETGGTFNGTIAGRMTTIKAPHSKINVSMGLLSCVPYHKTNIEGRGIFPDKEIIPTLEDRINDVDPEMNWILNDIKEGNSTTFIKSNN